MNDFKSSTNAMELLDNLRPSYRFICPDSASGLVGFVSGYSMAADFPAREFGDNMRRFSEAFFRSSLNEPWHELVEKKAVVQRSEIPLVYAISDFCRQVVYKKAFSSIPTTLSRESFYANQIQYSRSNALPAPKKLVLVEGSFDFWLLFFLDEFGDRYYEASMSSRDKLMAWARRMLGIEPSSWRLEDPGVFASRNDSEARFIGND